MSAPVLMAAGSAAALDITFDQATGLAGGAALGAVGGPVGGFIGGMLGRAIGRKIHHPPPQVDLTDLRSRPRVTPVGQEPVLNPVGEDRAVDSTPIRMLDVRPAETNARTYLASAPRSAAQAAAAHPVPVSAVVSDDPNAQPGTLDYQLNQLNARRAAEGEPRIQTIADAG